MCPVTLTDLAHTLDQFLDTEEVGTFRVRELPKHHKTYKRRVGLDFRSGFDAIAAQSLLDNYSYQIEGGNQYVLKARVTSQAELLPSRSPSPLTVARRARTRSLSSPESGDSVGRRNASLVAKISDAELDRLNTKLDVHLKDLKKQKMLVQKEKEWRMIAKKHKRARSSDSDRSRTSRTRDKSRSRSRSRSRSVPKRKRIRRSPAKGLRRLRSKDRRSESRRLSRSRGRDRPRMRSIKPTTPPGTPPPRPSHTVTRRRKMSAKTRTPSSPQKKSRSGAHGAEVIAVQRKRKIVTPRCDGPSTSKHQGPDQNEAMETELEARREGATLKILIEMETLLQNLDSKTGGKMAMTDKQTILQRVEQVIKERVACLRANRHLTISQLVTYYRCEYTRAHDVDLIQKLMTELNDVTKTLPDKDRSNVKDGSHPCSTQVSLDKVWSQLDKVLHDISLDKPKPQNPTETPKSSADESDSSQMTHVDVTINIVPKRKDLELKMNFGHDDVITQNIVPVPPAPAPNENKIARKKRAKKKAKKKAKNKAKNKMSILCFQPDATKPQPLLIKHGPKSISPNPKFILPVKNLIREMKAVIKHKTDDDLFIFVLKRNLRHRIRSLLKGKNYVVSKEIKNLYRERYPKNCDQNLIEELERDILAGKYEGVLESGDEREASPSDGNKQKSTDQIDDAIIQVPQDEPIAISDSDDEWQEVGETVTNTASLSNENQNVDETVDTKSTNHIVANIVSSECSHLLLLACNKPEDFLLEYIKIARKIVEKRVRNLVTLYSHLKFTEALKYYKTLFPKDSNKRLSDLISKIINNDVIDDDETEGCETTDGQNETNSVKTTYQSAITEEASSVLEETACNIKMEIDEGTISTLNIVKDVDIETTAEIASNIEQQTNTQAKDCKEIDIIYISTNTIKETPTTTEIASYIKIETETQDKDSNIKKMIKMEIDEGTSISTLNIVKDVDIETTAEIASNIEQQTNTQAKDCKEMDIIYISTNTIKETPTTTEMASNIKIETETQDKDSNIKEIDECPSIEYCKIKMEIDESTSISTLNIVKDVDIEQQTKTQAKDCKDIDIVISTNTIKGTPTTEIDSNIKTETETQDKDIREIDERSSIEY